MLIQDFKSKLFSGGARPNHFKCIITLPGGGPIQDIEFLAKASSLPASSVLDISTYYRGREVHFAGERTFQPWIVQVINTDDFFVRNALEGWHNSIQNYIATNGFKAPTLYQTDMRVIQLDRNDAPLKTYKFINAYPTDIGDIQLSFEIPNQIEEFSVQFVYDYFEPFAPPEG